MTIIGERDSLIANCIMLGNDIFSDYKAKLSDVNVLEKIQSDLDVLSIKLSTDALSGKMILEDVM